MLSPNIPHLLNQTTNVRYQTMFYCGRLSNLGISLRRATTTSVPR